MCLEKNPALRPRDAASLRHALAACGDASAWSEDDAREWWISFRARPNDKPTIREAIQVSPPTAEISRKTTSLGSA